MVVGFTLAVGALGVVHAEAASLTVSWTAPTTNADGTPLTDLGSYRIYLDTSNPTCPGASFFTVASPTTSPSSGQTLSNLITALSAGTTYTARVTAVDAAGNESACSGSASGVAQPDFSVTPSTTTSFGSVAIGSTVDRTFTVQNTSAAALSGSASVAAPYSILSGSPFSLAAGSSQTVTVRFRPTTSGTFAGNVNFTANGDTISRALSGAGTGTGGTTVTLTVTKSGSGSGTVTGSPAGINCGATCSQSVAPGSALTLTAAPAAGSTFAGWSGACSGTGSCAVTVSAATTVTATFNLAAPSSPPGAPGTPSVTQLSADTTGVTFAFAWTVGSGATSYSYMVAFGDGSGAQQGTVTAPSLQLRMPYSPSGAAVTGFICIQSVNPAGQISASQSCNAVPVPARGSAPAPAPVTLSVTKNGSGSGTVTGSPAGINCGATCSQSVTPGTVVTLTAAPAAGSTFAGWSGACSGTGACAVAVNAATSVTATFNTNATPVTVSVTKSGSGSGTITSSPAGINCGATCSQSVAPGTALTLTAAPAAGSTFAGWSGACSGTGSCAVTVNAATTVTATFNLAAPSSPPGAPGTPSVTRLSADTTGVTFAFAWTAGSGATYYTYLVAFGDGSGAQQGSVTAPSLQLRMPYHSSGAAVTGFICVQSVNAAGQTSASQSCNAVPVPARPGG